MSEHPDEPSDETLMRSYSAGDDGAFERLFQRHRRPLFTYFLHHTGSAATAEDLFQEAFLRLIRGCAEYRPTGSFRSWLFTIAHNVMTDDRRRSALRSPAEDRRIEQDEARHAEVDEPAEVGGTRDDPLLRTSARDLREHIEAALLRLPEPQREVFLLRERAGLDLRSIAQATGSNLATVKSRMRYALAGLRRLLSDDLASMPELFHE
jgi:RNA polymerase sigma-70 factor (ECF subfamily)